MRKPPARRRQQQVKGGLKGFADAKKPSVDLLRDIQSHVVAQGVQNAGVGRESHKIHVSELVKDTACPRHMYYKISEAEVTDTIPPATAQLERIWAAGHAEHAKWQRWLHEMGDLWGEWKCTRCLHTFTALAPKECEGCGYVGFLEYEEVNLAVYPLVGHADGAVPRLNTLVEVKSFSVGSVRYDSPKLVSEHTLKIEGRSVVDHEGLWKAVKRPLRSHLVQGLMYLWMCKQMGLPYDRIVFIYENKTTQATKTFEVKLTERHLKDYLATLEEVKRAHQEGVAPARPELFAPESKPCNACPFRTLCWGEKISDNGQESTAVSVGGPSARSEEAGGEAEVRPAAETSRSDAAGSRGHHRTGRPRTDRADDVADPVGRAPRRAVGDGRGRRAVGRSRDGEVEGPRFARRNR